MKKLYTFAMAIAVVLTASANTRQQAVPFIKPAKAVSEVTSLTGPSFAAKAVGFTALAEVTGDYDWNYYGLLNGDSGPKTGVVTLTVTDETTGAVEISGIFSAGSGITGKITGTVDLKSGTLTMANKQDLGKDSYGDQNYFYFKELTEDGDLKDGASAVESVAAKIEGKSFKFPEDVVFAVGDFNDEDLGWWKLTTENSFDEYVEPTDGIDLTEWTEFTTATMIDGWILPALTNQAGDYLNAEDYPLNVKVARNNDDPNLLLIENPYVYAISGFPMNGTETGYIVLDITDPEFVLVLPGVFSGFTNGTNRVYCINVESFYVSAGYSKEVIQSALGADIPEWSTLTEVDGNSVISIPTCRFNYPSALDKMYTWTGRADAMKAKFTFKGTLGVKNVTVAENADAPVEYFNLQGVRVAEPQAGSLVIRRQGSNVTKVLVK